MKDLFILFSLLFVQLGSFAQCEIKNKVFPDQTMYYFMEPVLFFQTDKNLLHGNVTTDHDNYFLQFMPEPFPIKSEGKKFKSDAEIKLSNDSIYKLKAYDFRYRKTDSTLVLMFLLPKKQIEEFENHDVQWVNLDVGDEKGPRHFIFVIHKAALREQIKCLKDNH